MNDSLRYYGLAASCENTPNDRALALLVKAHVLRCKIDGDKAEAEMWQRIAESRNWLDAQDESDINHILKSD